MSDDQNHDAVRESAEEVLQQLKDASEEMRQRQQRTQDLITESADFVDKINFDLRQPPFNREDN